MRVLIFIIWILVLSCEPNYNPAAESSHVDSLNRARLSEMLGNMFHQIKTYNFTHDPDIDFVALLKLHHITAVDMAHREVEWGKDVGLIKFAKDIVSSESEEINMLDEYEHNHRPDNRDTLFYNQAISELSKEPAPIMKGNIDTVFATVILKHHQLAIQLSKIYLNYSHDEEVKKIAEEAISHHQQNILKLEK